MTRHAFCGINANVSTFIYDPTSGHPMICQRCLATYTRHHPPSGA